MPRQRDRTGAGLSDMEIIIEAARQIGDDAKPFKDVRDAFDTFGRKLLRLKQEQIAAINRAVGYGKQQQPSDLDDEIPF